MKKALLNLVLIVSVVLLNSCNKDGSNTDPKNQAPETFGLIGVSNGATDVDVMPSFSWTAATDPDGDAITYDLYIDSNENPTTLFAEDIMATSYQLQKPLSLTNQYYWKVVAKDNNGGSTESDATYGFTTRNLNFPNTPATANAPFGGKLDHTTVVFDNKLWVIGGSDGFLSYKNDVWYSENGSTWKKATSNAAFSERYRHTTVVFNDKLWVIGGWDGDNKNDVWNSEDGVTWTQATANAGFSKRNHHTTVVFDNKLWVIGGITDGIIGGRENDVWYSTDGSNWVQATENAAFTKRSGHTTVVFNNRLWLIGGFDGGPENDVWFSADGDTWTQAAKNAAFTERNDHTTAVFNNKIWVIAGFDGLIRRDVWYMD